MTIFNANDKVLVDYTTANGQTTTYPAEVIEHLGDGDPPTAYRVNMGWLIAIVPSAQVRAP